MKDTTTPMIGGIRIVHLEYALAALRFKAHHDAGQSQAPGLFAPEDTMEHEAANAIQFAIDHQQHIPAAFKERADVLAFQQKFKVPMASEPSFLDSSTFTFRLRFMQEELLEWELAHLAGNMHEAADALVDLAYVLHGTALMMGLPWPILWAEVQRANMEKIRAANADASKRKSALDVIKPEGWRGPDHTAALGTGPWPILNAGEKS